MAPNRSPRLGLSDTDSLMWRIEADPVLRSPVLVVGMLDRAPRPKRLRASVERLTQLLPQLRHRVVTTPGVGRLQWAPDLGFRLDHHLRWVGVHGGGGVRSVLDLAEPDVTTPFDPARPPWTLTVVEGLDGGRAALLLRFHHVVTDGIGGLHAAADLFDRSRRPAEAAALSGPDRPPVGGDLGSAAPGEVPHRQALRLPVGLDRLLGVAGTVATLARTPRDSVVGTVQLAASVRRLLAPMPPGSPLLVGRGLDRRLHVLELPLARLRAAASAVDATVNDVLLAAVGGAFHAYHRHQQASVPTMNVTMPVDVRGSDDSAGGNHFAPTRFTLPVDEADPATRTRIVGALARTVRDEPALLVTDAVAGALNRLPGPVVTRVLGGLLRSIDADVVDLPGSVEPTYLAGARVERLWAFAPPAGAALSVTLLSHVGTCCVAVAYDRSAVARPERFTHELEASFDELMEMGT